MSPNPQPTFLLAASLGLFFAGCVGPSSPPSGPEATDPEFVPEPVTLPVAWDGHFSAAACTPGGRENCLSLAGGPDQTTYDAPLDGGEPLQIRINLTWTPETPLTKTLELVVQGVFACDGCTNSTGPRSTAGPSPIHLDLRNVTGLGFLRLEVRQSGLDIGPSVSPQSDVGIPSAQAPQAFRLEGSIVVRPSTVEAADPPPASDTAWV